jgi:hypothetical protein
MKTKARNGDVAVARIPAVHVDQYDWLALSKELDGYGYAVLPGLIEGEDCAAIAAMYPDERHFRSHVHMARHGFGKGEYKYFRYPLPDLLGGLLTALYPHLASLANTWNLRMGVERRYTERHADFLESCHAAGQT